MTFFESAPKTLENYIEISATPPDKTTSELATSNTPFHKVPPPSIDPPPIIPTPLSKYIKSSIPSFTTSPFRPLPPIYLVSNFPQKFGYLQHYVMYHYDMLLRNRYIKGHFC